ncbi:MAG: hypothetical protein IJ222_01395, partial [Bacteroidales bacterium]|nr:hypothetical protein [Bacteroidales bacterium]
MKKVYVILAVAALTLCVASCGNKKKAQEAEQEATECCTKAEGDCCAKEEGECCKSAAEEVKDAAAAAA